MSEIAVWFPAVRCGSGADVFTERLAQALVQRGQRAEITWLPLRAEYAPWTVKNPRPPKWATIVHVNSWLHPCFLPRHLPVVSTVHHVVHDPGLRPFKQPLQALYHAVWIRHVEAANLQAASHVVAVSNYTAQAAHRAFGIARLDVIYNGVDTGFFSPIPRENPNNPFRLLFVGNWNRRKGVDLLAPIMRALGNDFQLIYTADRHGVHEQFPLPPNSRCLGHLTLERLREAYQSADALLFPSRLEGFGLAVAEAMACGLPVIAAATSSLPELVEHNHTGLLCPMDDVGAFVAAAQRLAADRALWQAMRQAARQRAVELFDEKRQVARWLDLYRSVIESHSS